MNFHCVVRGEAWEPARCEAMLERIAADVENETGLTISLGAASTRSLAMIAAHRSSPRGIRAVFDGAAEAFLAELSVDDIPGWSEAQRTAFRQNHLYTLGQVRKVPKEALRTAFGPADGERIWATARGRDARKTEAIVRKLPEQWLERTIVLDSTASESLTHADAIAFLAARIAAGMEQRSARACAAMLQLQAGDGTVTRRLVRLPQATRSVDALRVCAERLFAELRRDGQSIVAVTLGAEFVLDSSAARPRTETVYGWQWIWDVLRKARPSMRQSRPQGHLAAI